MKLAHLILAHNQPRQLERLIRRLAHPDADTYIHLDKKTPIADFEHLKDIENVYFIQNRVKVYWGTFAIVQATLNGFNEIIQSGKNYQYVNLLSGQDYPLKPQDAIHQYLEKNAGTAFMDYLLFEPDWREALPRVQSYHFNNLRVPGKFALQGWVNKVMPQRKMPNGLIPVGRSQWFTVPLECVVYMCDYWQKNAALRRFIKLTWAPDEFIFQTILYNSVYKNRMVNDGLRYIDWSNGGVSPKTLTLDDAGALMESGKLFARKFDMDKHAGILDHIDKQIDT